MRRSFYGSTPIISISYSLHQPFQNRTIPLTFRNANIYMHLYAFTFALSHALFVGRGARPSRCTKPLHSHNLLKSTSVASPRTTLLPFNERSVGFASALSPLSSPTLPKPHYPTKIAITLASPRKRGGGTADTIFSLAVQYSDSPAFTILKLFRAVTVGIEIDRSTIFKSSKQTQSPPS